MAATSSSASSSAPVAQAGHTLIDCDANLLHDDLRDQLEEHIDRARALGVHHFVVPGSTLDDSLAAIELARRRPGTVVATAGVHPFHAGQLSELDATMAEVERLAMMPEARCVGECGLDYSEGFPPRERQLPLFERHIELACRLKQPLFVHSRAAHDDVMRLLRKHQQHLPPLLVHCFTETQLEMDAYRSLDAFISFSGWLLSPKKVAAAGVADIAALVQSVPSERLLLETDAPYMGFKGCRATETRKPKANSPNVPASLVRVADEAARLRAVPLQTLAQQTTDCARSFFRF